MTKRSNGAAGRTQDLVKRGFDLLSVTVLLIALSPVIALVSSLIFLQDFSFPFYIGQRVGRDGALFPMMKFRSMVTHADQTGVMSTAGDDMRITRLGRVIRSAKLDELPQLFNVLVGQMSFVGPRPNVPAEVSLYSEEEQRLLSVRPGITDFASIVFADEGEILRGSSDPDRDYNLLIRPWKNRLGIHYVAVRSLAVDVQLIWLTMVAVLSRSRALGGVVRLLEATGADSELIQVSHRVLDFEPALPPGVSDVDWEEHLRYGPKRTSR